MQNKRKQVFDLENKVPLTQQQYDDSKARLQYLEKVKLKEDSAAIAAAVEKGDLSENAEYDAALDEQGKTFGEIAKLKHKLANSFIIKVNENEAVDGANVGNYVTIKNISTEETETIQLLGEGTGYDTISIYAPLGKVLLGKKEGDIVELETPKFGDITYKILKVK